MRARLAAVTRKLDQFRAVQKSLRGHSDLNELRVLLNALGSKLRDRYSTAAIEEMGKVADVVKHEDERCKQVIQYCADQATIRGQQRRASLRIGTECAGGDSPGVMLWLHEFVRRKRQEVDDVASSVEELNNKMQELSPAGGKQ